MTQLGDISSDIATLVTEAPSVIGSLATIVRKGKPYVATLRSIVDDPALPAFMDRIKAMAELEAGAPSGGGAPSPTDRGVGLKYFVPPLDAYIYARRKPIVALAIAGGIVALIGGIGYRYGKRRSKV